MSELDPQVKVLLEQVQAMAAQRPSLTSQPQMMPGTLWSGCPGMLLRLASMLNGSRSEAIAQAAA